MSSLTLNLVALAHYKLRSVDTGGMKDNLSLHRWVLLKNSITTHDRQSNLTAQNAASQADAAEEGEVASMLDDVKSMLPDPGDEEEAQSDLATQKPASQADAADSSSVVNTDLKDEMNSSLDNVEYMFPDPEDDLGTPEMSEEQWLDSLLENLGDEDSEDEDEARARISPVSIGDSNTEQSENHSRSEMTALCTSLSEEFAMPEPITGPYPEQHPLLTYLLEHDSHDCCSMTVMEESEGSVPDAIDDTSDDESEWLSTPFSRSCASLSLVDPASIPLPQDQNEPYIHDGSNAFFPNEEDPIPYSDTLSNSTRVYSPYHQGC